VLHVGDWVAVAVPGTVRSLAAERRYIPPSIPLLKQIAAGPGETVCASGSHITLEGKQLAVRRHADGNGRPLPWWEGCRTLRPGDIFLLNAASPASFDGRYFGPSPAGDVIGIARPLWLR
jgi:conjugative transfer signal peptidase TraF